MDDAIQHGYRPAPGTQRCGNCSFANTEGRDGVWCRMFRFVADPKATCDEWEPRK